MGEKEISEFISYLAVKREVASSTQNQALNAIVFLYKQVLHIDLGDFGPMERAKKPERLPVVLSKNEARRVLLFMSGVHKLMAQLLYGCGLRLMECVRLRVKDIDFDQNQIIVRDGKGMKERSTMLPELLRDILRDQIQKVKMVRDQDIKEGSALPWIGRLCASRQLIADSESRFAGLVVFRPEWSAWGHDVSFSGLSWQRHWSSRLNSLRSFSFGKI
jgi:integrase